MTRPGTRLLLTLLRRRALTFAADALLGAAFFLVGLVPGLLAKAVFDTLGRPGGASVALLLGVLVLVKVAHVGLGIGWMALDTALRGQLLMRLRRNLFDRVLPRPGTPASSVPTGDVLSRFVEDVRQVVETLCKRSGLMNLTSSLSFTAVGLVIMLRIDAYVTVLVVLPVLGVLVLGYLAGQRITLYRVRSRAAAGDVATFLTDLFAGAQLVKLTGAEDRVVARLMEMNRVRRRAAIRDSVFFTLLGSTSRLVLALGTGLILLVATDQLRSGAFSIGDLALFTYLLGEIGVGVLVLGDFLRQWRQTDVAAGRLAVLDPDRPLTALAGPVPAPVPAPPPDRLRVLEVRGLGHRPAQGGPGIGGIDLTLAAGSVTVVTGPVGSGKTTLVRCLLGLLPADAGEVRWNGTAVDPAVMLRPPRCAYTPQLPAFFNATVRENILLGVPSDGTVEVAAARRAVFEEDLAGMPAGFDTPVGPFGHRLSGGQRQRLAVARMFARPAELLVLDDVSSALDERTEELLWQRLFAAATGAALLVVSTRRAPLLRADEIVVLAGGRVAARGDLPTLLAGSAGFRAVCPAGLAEAVAGRSSSTQ